MLPGRRGRVATWRVKRPGPARSLPLCALAQAGPQHEGQHHGGFYPLRKLLARAGNVFDLAGKLGRAIRDDWEEQRQRGEIDPAGWSRHESLFDEFCNGCWPFGKRC